jgi:hypothetical protein
VVNAPPAREAIARSKRRRQPDCRVDKSSVAEALRAIRRSNFDIIGKICCDEKMRFDVIEKDCRSL